MSNPIPYKLVKGGDKPDVVVAFDPKSDEPVKKADANHAHWSEILIRLERGDESVFELFDVAGGVVSRLRRLSDRVEYDGKNILWDGDVIDNSLSQQVKEMLQKGESDYKPLVAFWEKISQNPNEDSKKQLFDFLQQKKFSITDDGDIIAYKGVNAVGSTGYASTKEQTPIDSKEFPWKSVSAGKAFVDGVEYKGLIPNKPGAVVTMPRSEVRWDPNQTCTVGLHVGTWDYAVKFGSRDITLEVHINPRDVVSVPRDGGKMRVCKYVVVDKVDKPHQSNIVKKASREVNQVGVPL